MNILPNTNTLPLDLQIFAIYTQKSAIFDKSAILDNFPLLKVENMGKFFHNFFRWPGKNLFFGRIFTYVGYQYNSSIVNIIRAYIHIN